MSPADELFKSVVQGVSYCFKVVFRIRQCAGSMSVLDLDAGDELSELRWSVAVSGPKFDQVNHGLQNLV